MYIGRFKKYILTSLSYRQYFYRDSSVFFRGNNWNDFIMGLRDKGLGHNEPVPRTNNDEISIVENISQEVSSKFDIS